MVAATRQLSVTVGLPSATVLEVQSPASVVAAVAAGGQDSVGVRCPAHPVAQSLLKTARAHGVLGVAAPSANRFGRVSPTTAAHVAEEFAELGDEQLLILDGGACPVGIESTIVDFSRGAPVLLRPGMVTPAQIEAACGLPLRARDEAAPRASGTLESHYAPRAQVRLMAATRSHHFDSLTHLPDASLAAFLLAGIYLPLAAFPALAMPFVLGGVTAGEFWRMLLALLNALFFSLAAGMLENRGFAMEPVLRAWQELSARFENIIVEGCGGWEVPLTDRLTVADLAADLGEDRHRERIPFGQQVALLDVGAVYEEQPCAVGQAIALALAPRLVLNHDFAVAVHDDGVLLALDELDVLQANHAVVAGLELRLLGADLTNAADVEGTHGELGAGLADGLGGDDADRFAHIDDVAACKVTTIAFSADAVHQLTG